MVFIKIYKWNIDWKGILKTTYAPTIISLIIFFTNYKFFGLENVIIAPYMTLTFIRMKNYVTIEKNPIKSLFIHVTIGVIAAIASFNFVNAIVIDFLGGVILTYLLTDEYNPSSYFPYLMGFVFLQLFPSTFNNIPYRILAIVYSYMIVYIGLKIFSPKMMTSKIRMLVKDGYKNIGKQLNLLKEGNFKEIEENSFKLFEIGKELNRLIYSSGKNKYFSFVIFFQHMNNLITDLCDLRYLTEANKEYLENCSKLFYDIENLCNERNQLNIINEIFKFLDNNKFSDRDIENYFSFTLNYLTSSVVEIYSKKDWSFKKIFDFKETKEYFSRINKYKISLNGFKMRFALRMGILLSVTFGFVRWSNLEKSYWIPMTVFLLTLPFYEDSKVRVRQRFTGTLIGLVISTILFTVFKSVTSHIVIIVISTFFMYAFVDYGIMTIYITCYALAISTLTIDSKEAIGLRIIYTFAALLIVLFANRFLFRTKNHIEMENMINRIIKLNGEMIYELDRILNDKFDNERLRSLIFSSYLISGKLQMHNNPKRTGEEYALLRDFIFKNNKFTTILAHEAMILNTHKDLDIEYTNECINRLKQILHEMNCVLNKSEYDESCTCKNISLINHKHNYANIQLFNCLVKGGEAFLALDNLYKTL